MSFFFIIFFILYLRFFDPKLNLDDLSSNIVLLYFYAFYRVFPSLQTIYTNFSSLKLHSNSIDYIHNKIQNNSKFITVKSKEILNFKQFKIENISLKFNKIIFKNLNFEINCNERIGIFGESGLGKSSFGKIMAGLIKPNSGDFYLNSKKLTNRSIVSLRDEIIYLNEESFIIEGTVYDNFFDLNYTDDSLKTLFKNFNILELLKNKKISDEGSNLSYGQKQRINIIRAIIKNPKLIILDEALNGIDEDNRKIILSYLIKTNITLILISHDIVFLKKYCTKIINFKDLFDNE